jgi:hypothetical protein
MAQRLIDDGYQTFTPEEAEKRQGGTLDSLLELFGKGKVSEIAGATEAPSGFSLGGIGSSGNYILPAAGAYGMYDVLSSKRGGTGAGALQGLASGAAMGSYFGPWGAAIGGGVGALGSLFGGKSRTKVEEERRDALREQGIDLGGNKGWESNEKFKQSRNESDLLGKDITGAASMYSIFGPQYQKATEEARSQVGDALIKNQAIREHHGTIDVLSDKLSPDLSKQLNDILGSSVSEPRSDQGAQKKERQQAQTNNKRKRQEAIAEAILPKPTMPGAPAGYTGTATPSYDYQSLINKAMGR